MSTPYGPVLIAHFRNPHNQGTLASPTISQEGTNPLCGDRVRIELLLDLRTLLGVLILLVLLVLVLLILRSRCCDLTKGRSSRWFDCGRNALCG